MGIAITIIICVVLLCIVPSIGTRHPRGYQPRIRRLADPIALDPDLSYDPGHPRSRKNIDEETIRRIVREELAKQNEIDLDIKVRKI